VVNGVITGFKWRTLNIRSHSSRVWHLLISSMLQLVVLQKGNGLFFIQVAFSPNEST